MAMSNDLSALAQESLHHQGYRGRNSNAYQTQPPLAAGEHSWKTTMGRQTPMRDARGVPASATCPIPFYSSGHPLNSPSSKPSAGPPMHWAAFGSSTNGSSSSRFNSMRSPPAYQHAESRQRDDDIPAPTGRRSSTDQTRKYSSSVSGRGRYTGDEERMTNKHDEGELGSRRGDKTFERSSMGSVGDEERLRPTGIGRNEDSTPPKETRRKKSPKGKKSKSKKKEEEGMEITFGGGDSLPDGGWPSFADAEEWPTD